jgi:menaquinone-dependent protoporphyrinogen oxidase
VGRYQAPLVHYAQVHHERLNAMPSAFLSVSLSAAGESPDDWAGVEECLATFKAETGWTPGRVHQAAGAIRYSQYDFFKRLALQAIARKRGLKTVRSHDYDLTDYDALRAFATGFATAAAPV